MVVGSLKTRDQPDGRPQAQGVKPGHPNVRPRKILRLVSLPPLAHPLKQTPLWGGFSKGIYRSQFQSHWQYGFRRVIEGDGATEAQVSTCPTLARRMDASEMERRKRQRASHGLFSDEIREQTPRKKSRFSDASRRSDNAWDGPRDVLELGGHQRLEALARPAV
mmetsp:Transcript_24694/g.75292  ORF Transcript_24694/g.75292 Transcript_24694/m.75292 type:complete len:164 (+) Transcript_24694:770-1261(+)|eukprot:scaffold51929_cov31-Tisochrysis_lutea.AAC.4